MKQARDKRADDCGQRAVADFCVIVFMPLN
jgi:hypothetical protein